ncbi:MAG: PAS domain-containing protein [Desulfobacterales bacterium]
MVDRPTYEELSARVQELERALSDLQSPPCEPIAENSFQRMVQAANSVILTLSPAGDITFINDYGLSFFGYPEEEILGRSLVGTIVPQKDRNGFDLSAMIAELVQEPDRFAVNENENVKKSGERVWLAWTNRAVRNADGSLREIICVGNDITAPKEAERKLEQTTRQLKERVKELDCLYSISGLRDRTDFSLDDSLQAIVDLIPPSWQYPEIACARVLLERYQIATENFKKTDWRLRSEIRVSGQKAAVIEVCYLQLPPGKDEAPFLPEEQRLLDAIAERIGKIIEREWMEEDMRRLT